jgi:hypothetical protein
MGCLKLARQWIVDRFHSSVYMCTDAYVCVYVLCQFYVFSK